MRVRKTPFLRCHCCPEIDRFAKTGSGQPYEKLREKTSSAGQDRPIDVGLGLPGQQETLLASVAAGLGPKTKLAMVLVAGGPVDITAARDNTRVGAKSPLFGAIF